MQWPGADFDWNQVRAFLATAEAGSLSAAARMTGQTQPTLGRQVAALEARLGVVLFERVGRSLELTSTGRDLLQHVRTMGAAAERMSLVARGLSEAVEGQVSISAADGIASMLLPRALARIRETAPGIAIEVIAANEISDLQRREADIAIRHVRPDAPDLVARLLGESVAHFYASRDYLDRRGRPRILADMAEHDIIGLSTPEQFAEGLTQRGVPTDPARIPLFSTHSVVTWELARAGLGVTMISDGVAARWPEMERILPEVEVRFPTWLTVHREVRTSRRIRLVYDHLAEALPLP
ncbi:MAG: LysR family transcriptional regulator [Pseudomonadota bacterium]